jgi:hypothetical protein
MDNTLVQNSRPLEERVDRKIVFYENDIPDFFELQLERIYECYFSTYLRFGQYYRLDRSTAYAVFDNDVISTVLLFEISKDELRVFNEQIQIDHCDIVAFVKAAFQRFPKIAKIHFYAIETDIKEMRSCVHSTECLEDIRLLLPKTCEEFKSKLSRSTAEFLRKMPARIRRDYPSFSFEITCGSGIDERSILAVIELNRLRMAAKGKKSYHTEESTKKLLELVRRYGRVGIGRIGDKICGGFILLRVASKSYLHTLAHDPQFDYYRLGYLFCYYGIESAIISGSSEFHFGWGRYEYKFKLLGSSCPLYSLLIFRNHVAMFRNTPEIAKRIISSVRRKYIIRGEQNRRSRSFLAQLAVSVFHFFQKNQT